MAKIGVFFAEGYEEIEALTVVDLCRRAGIEVEMVSVYGKESVCGAHGIDVKMDKTFAEADFDGMDMIVLPGGMPGTLNLEKSPIVTVCAEYCVRNGVYLGAICAAPSILGHLGLLKDKEATCFPGFEGQLFGAKVTDKPVCVDGTIITAKGMGVSAEFALTLTALMAGQQEADRIRASIQSLH